MTSEVYKSVWQDVPMGRSGLLALAAHYCAEEGVSLLYSGSHASGAGVSYFFLRPLQEVVVDTEKDPWKALEELLPFPEGPAEPLPLWVGFLSYELGAYSDLDVVLPHTRSTALPLAHFCRYAFVLQVDHTSNLATLWQATEPSEALCTQQQELYSFLVEYPSTADRVNSSSPKGYTPAPLSCGIQCIQEHCDEPFACYKEKVLQAQELIRAGDIYQVNLSQRFVFPPSDAAFALFQTLAEQNPSPYSAYLCRKGYSIVSSSPECLLKKAGTLLETRPIKGTTSRGHTPEDDERQRYALIHSEKDQAELLMITDLMRNDLGRIAVPGSVCVPSLWDCEAYTNVFHLVATIRAQAVAAAPSAAIPLLRACFPGGSITGCPKLRAMEVIHSLERRSRGIYTGSIGYFSCNGDFDFNIAIRTLFLTPEYVEVQLGGAIVYDSTPENEYNETLHKGASIFKALYPPLSDSR